MPHPPPPPISPLSLHDALPISRLCHRERNSRGNLRNQRKLLLQLHPCDSGRIHWHLHHGRGSPPFRNRAGQQDRKSTRLNSSHLGISYAVFCLKKKKTKRQHTQ